MMAQVCVLCFPFRFSYHSVSLGHWKTGCWADETHPNDAGHKLMFEVIPIDSILECLAERTAHKSTHSLL